MTRDRLLLLERGLIILACYDMRPQEDRWMDGWIDGKKDRHISNVTTGVGEASESFKCLKRNKATGQMESFKLYQMLSQPG